MDKFIIDFYSKENGEQPAKDFILALEPKMQAKIIRVLDLLGNNGPLTGLPYSEHLENGTRNPSLAMLKRLAKGIGMQLKVEFIPQVERR